MIENVRGNRLFLLFNSVTKSEAYFRARRWQGRRYCPRCKYQRKIYHYLKEIEFRFNSRNEDLFNKIVKLLLISEKPIKFKLPSLKSKSKEIHLSQKIHHSKILNPSFSV